ncbi:hypothetical protein BD626DRAFT_572477 [Schizophyllum amplum]|uniref:Uncharacterized protein n=1 Tax=Schizophyllum amplum TaxID=97359 RepID=A0A550C414_9AGAR|nr:hypothetical protein BD626DRAFT_572477 [Auriculariopsis ampla]
MVPHEIVLVRFSHAVIDADGATIGTDHRIAKFERVKHYRSGDEDGYLAPVPLFSTSRGASRDCKARARLPARSAFTPDRGALNIVDCAAAAYVVSERSRDYSTLQYMDLWYARMLFESLRHLAKAPKTLPGPAYERAGTWRKAQMVTAEGRLVLDAHPADLVMLALASVRSAGENNESDVRDAIESDRAVDKQGSHLREVQGDIEVCRSETWKVIEQVAVTTYERVHRLSLLEAESQIARRAEAAR